MKNHVKVLFSALFCLSLVFSLCFFPSAQDAEGIEYVELPDGGVEITAYRDTNEIFSLPGVIDGEKVLSIGPGAFKDAQNLRELTLPDSIVKIGNESFRGCKSLERVNIPLNTESIGVQAFASCSKLTEISIPDGVKTIGSKAFSSCTKLDRISIGSGVESIGEDAFLSTAYYKNENNIVDGAIYIDGCLIKADPDLIPSDYTVFIRTKLIADGAFSDCVWLNSITLRKGVKSIGNKAFYNCKNLKSATINKDLNRIGDSAFSGCDNITDIYYEGGESDWDAVDIASIYSNHVLYDGKVFFHYNVDVPGNEPPTNESETTTLEDKVTESPNDSAANSPSDNTTNTANTTDAADTTSHTAAQDVKDYFLPDPDSGYETLDSGGVHLLIIEAGQSKESVQSRFKADSDIVNIEGKDLSEKEIVGTGSKATLTKLGETFVYTVIVPMDANCDGVITANDARKALRFSSRLEKADDILIRASDSDDDGKVTAFDARTILITSSKSA